MGFSPLSLPVECLQSLHDSLSSCIELAVQPILATKGVAIHLPSKDQILLMHLLGLINHLIVLVDHRLGDCRVFCLGIVHFVVDCSVVMCRAITWHCLLLTVLIGTGEMQIRQGLLDEPQLPHLCWEHLCMLTTQGPHVCKLIFETTAVGTTSFLLTLLMPWRAILQSMSMRFWSRSLTLQVHSKTHACLCLLIVLGDAACLCSHCTCLVSTVVTVFAT